MSRVAEFRSGWGTVLASTIGIALGLAPLGTTYTLGSLAGALSAEFGWSRAAVMSATIAATLGLLPASLAVGWACDRLGVRRVILVSQIGLSFSFAALGLFTNSLASFYLFYFLMGLLGAGSLPIAFAKAITARFEQARGLALGIALAGTGLCGFVMPAVTAFMAGAYGWRTAYLVLAALPIAIALPLVAALLPESPRTEAAGKAGNNLAAALGHWRFWLIAACFFPVSLAITGTITSLVPLLVDRGLSPVHAAELAGLTGVSVIAGRLLVGALVDRFWAPGVGLVFIAAPAAACLLLASDASGLGTIALAIVILGLATGAEIDLNAYLVSRYFGRDGYGRLYAIQYAIIIAGAGIASPIFGRVHDAAHSYAPALTTSAFAFLAGAFGLLLLGRYPTAGAVPQVTVK